MEYINNNDDLKDNYYLFSYNQDFYMYNLTNGALVQLTKRIYFIIKKYLYGQVLNDEENEYIEELICCGMISRKYYTIVKKNIFQNDVAYLSFAPVYSCNFRCRYCFGNHGDCFGGVERAFTKENLLKMLSCFFYDFFPNAKQYRIDFVSGGEPLLGFPIIRETIEYCESISAQTGKNISIWLCTNASLLTDEIIEYLSAHNVSIGISLDGEKDDNDSNRVFADGRGTYDTVVKGIKLIQSNKNVSKKFKHIWGLCAATNENCDFVSIINHLYSLGFKSVQIRLVRSKGEYCIEKIVCEYKKLSKFLLATFKEKDLTFLRMIINDNDQFGQLIKRIILGSLVWQRCNAGINKMTICPDGTIYPCDSLVGYSDFIIGDLASKKVNLKFFEGITVDSIEQCKDCDIRYLCGGDCYYNSLMKNGDITHPDNEFCELQRSIINISLVLCLNMQTYDDNLYARLAKEISIKEKYHESYG